MIQVRRKDGTVRWIGLPACYCVCISKWRIGFGVCLRVGKKAGEDSLSKIVSSSG
jgi:hypothetical protein